MTSIIDERKIPKKESFERIYKVVHRNSLGVFSVYHYHLKRVLDVLSVTGSRYSKHRKSFILDDSSIPDDANTDFFIRLMKQCLVENFNLKPNEIYFSKCKFKSSIVSFCHLAASLSFRQEDFDCCKECIVGTVCHQRSDLWLCKFIYRELEPIANEMFEFTKSECGDCVKDLVYMIKTNMKILNKW